MTGLRERFGRPLRLGIVGGGPDSWIGNLHRGAAGMDGWFCTTAGVFSSDAARSRAAGVVLGFDPARSYGDVAEMLAGEAKRADGIEAVSIMTPNDTHYPLAAAALDAGLDVLCDKPVSHDFAQACDLVARARSGGRLFAIAHAYSAYPMTRHARQLIRDGVIGELRFVQVEYVQSGLAVPIEQGPQNNRLRWMFDGERGGQLLVMSAIGCHAQHLACAVSGLNVARLVADAGALMPGRRVSDHVSALLEFDNGARGTFTATQAAAGGENDIRLRIVGSLGLIEWSHRDASYLRLAMQGGAVRTIGRGDPDLPAAILALGRTPRGHPEGLREAFANIYSEWARTRIAASLGDPAPDLPYPRIEEGAHTMAFIEACVRSQASGRWVDVAAVPMP